MTSYHWELLILLRVRPQSFNHSIFWEDNAWQVNGTGALTVVSLTEEYELTLNMPMLPSLTECIYQNPLL
jgi:hypothetical protein